MIPAPPGQTILTTPEGYTYEQLKANNWTDEQILQNPTWAHIVPIPAPVMPIPPSPIQPQEVIMDAIPSSTPPINQNPMGMFDLGIDFNAMANEINSSPENQFDFSDMSNTPIQNIESTFKPNVEDNLIISEINPAYFDILNKILAVLIKERATDTITIKNSKIKQALSGCNIEANMFEVFGKAINLDIINPKKYINLFGQMKNNNNIFIIDDTENQRYLVTNGEIRLFLPKQDNLINNRDIDDIDLTKAEIVCSLTIEKNARTTINKLMSNADYLEYLIQDNELKGIYIPDTAIYIFEQYQKDEKALNLNETNADLNLRVINFLPVEANTYFLTIYKFGPDKYGSITTCKIGGKIDVKIFEHCSLTTGGNIII